MTSRNEIEKQVLRLFMFTHKVCLPVVRRFFITIILCLPEYNNELKTFLEKHKHAMYHLLFGVKCCKCTDSIVGDNVDSQRISRKQFDKMFQLGNPIQSHIKRKDRRIYQHCCCGVKVNESLLIKYLDLSALNAIITASGINLKNSHQMWLDKIIKERNKLSHMSDSDQWTESLTQTMWANLEMAVLGLATDIPVESYEDDIQTQIDFLKVGDYSIGTVQPIIDTIKTEVENSVHELVQSQKEQLKDSVSDIVTQIRRSCVGDKNEIKDCLKDCLKESENEIISRTDKLSNIMCAQVASVSKEYVAKLSRKQDYNTHLLEQLLGTVHHKSNEVEFHVKYSTDSSLNMSEGSADVYEAKDNDIKNTQTDQSDSIDDPMKDPNIVDKCKEKGQPENTEVCIYWKIKPKDCSKAEEAKIKDNARKAAQSISCWFPYKISHIFEGCIVIGTLLPKDIFASKERFEMSIRKFLDTFVNVSGIDTDKTMCVEIEMVISKSPKTALSNYCRYEVARSLTQDKLVQASPQMSNKSTDATPKTMNKAHQTDFCEKEVDEIGSTVNRVVGIFDVMFLSGGSEEEQIWIERIAERLKINYGLSCGVPGRDYLNGISASQVALCFPQFCKSIILTMVNGKLTKTDKMLIEAIQTFNPEKLSVAVLGILDLEFEHKLKLDGFDPIRKKMLRRKKDEIAYEFFNFECIPSTMSLLPCSLSDHIWFPKLLKRLQKRIKCLEDSVIVDGTHSDCSVPATKGLQAVCFEMSFKTKLTEAVNVIFVGSKVDEIYLFRTVRSVIRKASHNMISAFATHKLTGRKADIVFLFLSSFDEKEVLEKNFEHLMSSTKIIMIDLTNDASKTQSANVDKSTIHAAEETVLIPNVAKMLFDICFNQAFPVSYIIQGSAENDERSILLVGSQIDSERIVQGIKTIEVDSRIRASSLVSNASVYDQRFIAVLVLKSTSDDANLAKFVESLKDKRHFNVSRRGDVRYDKSHFCTVTLDDNGSWIEEICRKSLNMFETFFVEIIVDQTIRKRQYGTYGTINPINTHTHSIYIGCTPDDKNWINNVTRHVAKSFMNSYSSSLIQRRNVNQVLNKRAVIIIPISGSMCTTDLLQSIFSSGLEQKQIIAMRVKPTKVPEELQQQECITLSEDYKYPTQLIHTIQRCFVAGFQFTSPGMKLLSLVIPQIDDNCVRCIGTYKDVEMLEKTTSELKALVGGCFELASMATFKILIVMLEENIKESSFFEKYLEKCLKSFTLTIAVIFDTKVTPRFEFDHILDASDKEQSFIQLIAEKIESYLRHADSTLMAEGRSDPDLDIRSNSSGISSCDMNELDDEIKKGDAEMTESYHLTGVQAAKTESSRYFKGKMDERGNYAQHKLALLENMYRNPRILLPTFHVPTDDHEVPILSADRNRKVRNKKFGVHRRRQSDHGSNEIITSLCWESNDESDQTK